MNTQIERIQLLYELAMSIGKSLVLDDMLRESLTVFIRKLNCMGAIVLHYQEQDDHTLRRAEVIALPRCIATQDSYRPLIEDLPSVITRQGYADLMARLPLACRYADREVLAMAMPRFGVLYLVRAKRAFDPILVRSIEALVHRLGDACLACVQDTEVRQARAQLEERVSSRTEMLEQSMNQLATAYEDVKRTQKQLVQSEKLASIGQLAAGVAHEINNPTGFVASNLSTMREYVATFKRWYDVVADLQHTLSDDEADPVALSETLKALTDLRRDEDLDELLQDADALLQESLDGTGRITRIVKDLRSFAHPDSDKVELTPLEHAIDDALRLSWNALKYKAEVHTQFESGLLVNCRTDQLTQVFINLLVNAAQAIESNGTIAVTTFAADGEAVAQVQDTGCGISEANLSKLFDPFFTTKEVGTGTGLGLSISHGIVERHGGRIEVSSTVGQGTTFSVHLPLVASNQTAETGGAYAETV